MKKNLLPFLLSSIVLLFSCTKEKSGLDEIASANASKDGTVLGRVPPPDEPGDCALTPFGLLGLQNGTFTINSSRNLIANVGYSKGVTSNTNQKIDNFTGGAYVHSQVSTFVYTAATYKPTEGIFRNTAETDAILNQANANAISASAVYASFSPHVVMGNVTSNQTINSVAMNTVVQMASLSYNSDVLNLVGIVGEDRGFIINVSGNFDFSQSEIRLTNVRPERVIFNFPNASSILINKAANIFNGTVLAPVGSVASGETCWSAEVAYARTRTHTHTHSHKARSAVDL